MDTTVTRGNGINGVRIYLELNDLIVVAQFRQALVSLRQLECPDGYYKIREGDVIDLHNFFNRILAKVPTLSGSNAFQPLSPEELEEAERELNRK